MGSSSYLSDIFTARWNKRVLYNVREKETSNSDLGESSVQNKQSKNFFFHFPFFDFFQKLEFFIVKGKIFVEKEKKWKPKNEFNDLDIFIRNDLNTAKSIKRV